MSLPNDTIQKIKLNPNDANTVKDIAPTMMTDSNRSYKAELDTLYEDEKIELKPFIGVLSTDYTIDSSGNFSNLSGRFLNALENKRDLQLQLPYNNSTADVIFRLEDYYSSSGNIMWMYKSFVTGLDGEQINQVLMISYDSSIPGFELFNLHNTTLVKDFQVNGNSIKDNFGNANINTQSAYNSSTNKIATMTDVNTKVNIRVTSSGKTSFVNNNGILSAIECDSTTRAGIVSVNPEVKLNYINLETSPQGTKDAARVLLNDNGVSVTVDTTQIANATFKYNDKEVATTDQIPTVPVDDVQLDSTSVVSSKIANFNTVTANRVNEICAGAGSNPSGLQTMLLNYIYPVGSIYMSVNNVSPATFLGGTWEQLKDKFLLGAGDTYSNGETGGEATHVLTEQEMPTHGNHLYKDYWDQNKGNANKLYLSTATMSQYGSTPRGWLGKDGEVYPAGQDLGENQAHNNMPPYLVVYMWKRTA